MAITPLLNAIFVLGP